MKKLSGIKAIQNGDVPVNLLKVTYERWYQKMKMVKLEIEIPEAYYDFCKEVDSIAKLKQIRKEIVNVIVNGKVIEITDDPTYD